MKNRILSLVLILSLCLGLAACAQGTSDSSAAESSKAESSTAESSVSESSAAESAAQSQLSGKVTVYMPSPAGLADKLAAAFTEKTGVEVEQFQGTTGEILARLEKVIK